MLNQPGTAAVSNKKRKLVALYTIFVCLHRAKLRRRAKLNSATKNRTKRHIVVLEHLQFSARKFHTFYRMSPHTFKLLHTRLANSIEQAYGDNVSISSELRLLILLRYLSGSK